MYHIMEACFLMSHSSTGFLSASHYFYVTILDLHPSEILTPDFYDVIVSVDFGGMPEFIKIHWRFRLLLYSCDQIQLIEKWRKFLTEIKLNLNVKIFQAKVACYCCTQNSTCSM